MLIYLELIYCYNITEKRKAKEINYLIARYLWLNSCLNGFKDKYEKLAVTIKFINFI
jgi:hypothetical protein